MGLKDGSLLDESFYFIGPFDGPLGKEPFLEGSKSFDLRGAFPDFDFNAHHFRVDEVEMDLQEKEPTEVERKPNQEESNTTIGRRRVGRVWFSTKKTGTHLGKLPMYGEIYEPTGKTLDFPLECYSLSFDLMTGKCVKMTGGFVFDHTQ